MLVSLLDVPILRCTFIENGPEKEANTELPALSGSTDCRRGVDPIDRVQLPGVQQMKSVTKLIRGKRRVDQAFTSKEETGAEDVFPRATGVPRSRFTSVVTANERKTQSKQGAAGG